MTTHVRSSIYIYYKKIMVNNRGTFNAKTSNAALGCYIFTLSRSENKRHGSDGSDTKDYNISWVKYDRKNKQNL